MGLFGKPLSREEDPTGGQLIYAIGDVHGRYDLLKLLLAAIARDWARTAPDRQPVLIFCGDYIDRGGGSAHVVEALIWLKKRGDMQVHCLMGNHEQAFLRFLENPVAGRGWIELGGAETLRSYGVAPPKAEDPDAYVQARDLLTMRMPSSHLRFIEHLELMLVVGDYAFVHAGVQPGVDLRHQREEHLLWIRKEFLEDDGPFEKVIVHGHSWSSSQPQILEHRIGIDTGAYVTGVLSAVRLDGAEIDLLQATGAGLLSTGRPDNSGGLRSALTNESPPQDRPWP